MSSNMQPKNCVSFCILHFYTTLLDSLWCSSRGRGLRFLSGRTQPLDHGEFACQAIVGRSTSIQINAGKEIDRKEGSNRDLLLFYKTSVGHSGRFF